MLYALGIANCACQWRLVWRTDCPAICRRQVNLQLLLEDARVQQEWAAQLLACRGPAFAQLFTVLINKLRPTGRSGPPGTLEDGTKLLILLIGLTRR